MRKLVIIDIPPVPVIVSKVYPVVRPDSRVLSKDAYGIDTLAFAWVSGGPDHHQVFGMRISELGIDLVVGFSQDSKRRDYRRGCRPPA